MKQLHQKEYTLIFDFDGTIADSFSAMTKIFNRLAPKYGYKTLSESEIEALRGKNARDVIKALKISLLKVPLVFREGRSAFEKEIKHIEPIIGMPAVLHELAQSYQLGIVTSNSVKNVRHFTKQHDLDLFEFIYSEKSLFGKGNVLKKLLKTFALPPEKVLYIGDEVRDIEAAREAGIRVISVGWGFNTEVVLRADSPDSYITEPSKLTKTVSELLDAK